MVQVDPLDNAVLLVIEEGDQSGYPCEQVQLCAFIYPCMDVLVACHVAEKSVRVPMRANAVMCSYVYCGYVQLYILSYA